MHSVVVVVVVADFFIYIFFFFSFRFYFTGCGSISIAYNCNGCNMALENYYGHNEANLVFEAKLGCEKRRRKKKKEKKIYEKPNEFNRRTRRRVNVTIKSNCTFYDMIREPEHYYVRASLNPATATAVPVQKYNVSIHSLCVRARLRVCVRNKIGNLCSKMKKKYKIPCDDRANWPIEQEKKIITEFKKQVSIRCLFTFNFII